MVTLKEGLTENGFFHIPNAFSPEEVEHLVQATQNVLENPDFEYDFLKINQDKHVHKIRYMFEKDPAFRKAIVHDAILSIVTQLISSKDFIVPTWEDMLIKVPLKGIPVTVHQDLALQSVGSDVFSLGVYLHDSDLNPVYYLPKSHKKGPLTRTEIYQVYEEERDKFTPLKAKAGDIIIHNVKTVHFSKENKSPTPRYTWYLEFRTKKQLEEDSPWDQNWINCRRAIWVDALKKYQPNRTSLIPDFEEMKSYMDPLKMRISHTNDEIDYDMKSPYNHFSEES